MKLICPYVPIADPSKNRLSLQPATYDFVLKHKGELVDCSSDDFAYFRLFKRLWEAGEAFVLVEHDIVPSEDGYASLARCNHSWCGCPYMGPYGMANYLGCTRFAAGLMKRAPDLPRRMEALDHYGNINPLAWYRMDTAVDAVLTHQIKAKHHVHAQHPVWHVKTYG